MNSATAIERSTATFMARVRDPNTSNYPTHATTASISVTVTDTATAEIVVTYSPAVVDVLTDSPQANADWIGDVGCNLILVLSGSSMPPIGDYIITATITPVVGAAYSVTWRLQVLDEE